MVTEKDLTEALDLALNSVLCFCGNHKRIDKPLCFQCWDSLPFGWRQIFRGFELSPNNYDAARQWLIKHYPQRFAGLSQCLDKTR